MYNMCNSDDCNDYNNDEYAKFNNPIIRDDNNHHWQFLRAKVSNEFQDSSTMMLFGAVSVVDSCAISSCLTLLSPLKAAVELDRS